VIVHKYFPINRPGKKYFKMILLQSVAETQSYVQLLKQKGKKIGFVPTMGALHQGHLSLIKLARQENDVVLCSIFVNPIQFNNPEDLLKYPRTPETDMAMVEAAGCDAVFAPSVEEMYPEPDTTIYDFGLLDKVMEGRFRPGHFNGVAIVVRRLLEVTQADVAYFGEKDFQQLVIIQKMVEMLTLPVRIVSCPIVREQDGLAMSSRNQRLTQDERAIAPLLYQALQKAASHFTRFTPEELRVMIKADIEQNPLFEVEYIEIVDMDSLMPVSYWSGSNRIIICLAVYLGQVRLIDNIVLQQR
jgi:pantoate--beta-alanine ligase